MEKTAATKAGVYFSFGYLIGNGWCFPQMEASGLCWAHMPSIPPSTRRAKSLPFAWVRRYTAFKLKYAKQAFRFMGYGSGLFKPLAAFLIQGTARVIFHSPANANPLLIQVVRYLFL